jgi:hypothetical protein
VSSSGRVISRSVGSRLVERASGMAVVPVEEPGSEGGGRAAEGAASRSGRGALAVPRTTLALDLGDASQSPGRLVSGVPSWPGWVGTVIGQVAGCGDEGWWSNYPPPR